MPPRGETTDTRHDALAKCRQRVAGLWKSFWTSSVLSFNWASG